MVAPSFCLGKYTKNSSKAKCLATEIWIRSQKRGRYSLQVIRMTVSNGEVLNTNKSAVCNRGEASITVLSPRSLFYSRPEGPSLRKSYN